jgi:uncharacterized protein YecT (DUF1311 family)
VNAARLHRALHAGLAGIACLSGAAAAQTEPKIDCEKALSTVELNWCAGQEFEKADKKLNEIYKKVLAQIAGTDGMTRARRDQWAGAMREAQRHWIAFRDKDCGEVIGYEWSGGTGMTGAALGCMTSKTEARTKELEERYGER